MQIKINEWSILAGGHAQTGPEENIRLDRDTLAPSNAALVTRAAEICTGYDRPVASTRQAREMLDVLPQT